MKKLVVTIPVLAMVVWGHAQKGGMNISEIHTIEKVEGNRVKFRNPMDLGPAIRIMANNLPYGTSNTARLKNNTIISGIWSAAGTIPLQHRYW